MCIPLFEIIRLPLWWLMANPFSQLNFIEVYTASGTLASVVLRVFKRSHVARSDAPAAEDIARAMSFISTEPQERFHVRPVNLVLHADSSRARQSKDFDWPRSEEFDEADARAGPGTAYEVLVKDEGAYGYRRRSIDVAKHLASATSEQVDPRNTDRPQKKKKATREALFARFSHGRSSGPLRA